MTGMTRFGMRFCAGYHVKETEPQEGTGGNSHRSESRIKYEITSPVTTISSQHPVSFAKGRTNWLSHTRFTGISLGKVGLLEQKFFFQISTLNIHVIKEFPLITKVHYSPYKPHTTYNPLICTEEKTLETTALESLYGCQMTLSTLLIKSSIPLRSPPTQYHSFFLIHAFFVCSF